MMITVQVNAHAKRNLVTQLGPAKYKVWVNVVPEHGKANQKVIELLADFLAVPRSAIELKAGGASRKKIFSIQQ